MRELTGDYWEIAGNYDAICVTTNGIVKSNGCLVMGAGIALDFRNKFPGVDVKFGALVREHGNRAMRVKIGERDIVSFPTKNNYRDNSDINLIVKSANELVDMADKFGWGKILLTRPGCGNGNLNWEVVKTAIGSILDDRFDIITS